LTTTTTALSAVCSSVASSSAEYRDLLVSCATWNVTLPSAPRMPVARVTVWPSRRPERRTTSPWCPPSASATMVTVSPSTDGDRVSSGCIITLQRSLLTPLVLRRTAVFS
jgi:hypothetical protein